VRLGRRSHLCTWLPDLSRLPARAAIERPRGLVISVMTLCHN
jgi:hypothetical protein